ncbi:hypothetical protein AXG93_1129s1130 [Marchantia polymorpha subsp. ruderalis]|uniref:Protein kinase domain-containing protein n=1 Tax=Marchantia polymorpha subsp. ruderalis TaxID=1480154 RepID=A0A176W123_MARPO|nr:hypothetical protein AXG93_1129s1130 [Marchantia polymorpha subsp. ruderalis]
MIDLCSKFQDVDLSANGENINRPPFSKQNRVFVRSSVVHAGQHERDQNSDWWKQCGGRTMKTNRRRYLVALLALSVLALLALQNYDNRRCAEKRPATGSRARLQLQSNGSDCQRVCGNVSIPYPFGLSSQCAFSSYFVLECRTDLGANLTSDVPGPWPVLTSIRATSTLGQRFRNGTKTHRFFEVNFLPVSQIQSGFIVVDATDIKAMGCNMKVNASLSLDEQSPYWISQDNFFIVVSCSSSGSADGGYFKTQCGPVSCVNQYAMPYCNVYDCCIQTIGKNKAMAMDATGGIFQDFTNCGYSTVLYPDSFVGGGAGVGDGHYGVALSFSIPSNDTDRCNSVDAENNECSISAKCHNQLDGYYYINECERSNNCSSIATCVNIDGSYKCKCPKFMEGNGRDPQLDARGNDCSWIDRCQAELNVCPPYAKCTFDSSSGDLNCTCQDGTFGDGHVNGTRCTLKKTSNLPIIIGVSVGSVVAFIIINSILLWYFYRRKRRAFDPAIFSQQELLNEIENKEGAKKCKLFTFSELREATKDFSVELGAGGFGTVFEGTLRDGTKVAIKMAKHGMGETRHEAKQFVNEIVILSQLNHRNLVNLLGCCLEKRVPVLVYEFVSNGNLHEHIQMKRQTEAQRSSEALVDDTSYFRYPPLNWTLRLKIAIETAEALAYLHWGTSPPVYHRDVKCANILLDNTYNVKVADFGLSKLVPLEDTDANAVPTAIQGTPGYMDPALFDQYELTDKSDVYSYGVLLLVILTGQRPVDLTRQPRDQNLVNRCNRLMAQGLFSEMIDPELAEAVESPDTLEAIDAFAKLALKCASRDGQDRPTMKEVVSELQNIQGRRKLRNSISQRLKSLTKMVTFHREYSLVPLGDGQSSNSNSISTPSSTLVLPWSDSESSHLSSSGLSEFELSRQGSKSSTKYP